MDNVTVISKKKETPTVSTLGFVWDREVRIGQFIMVWEPGVGEVPMSLSSVNKTKSITVKNYGPTSASILSKSEGDTLFIRGPYGRPFTLVKGKKLVVGGGSGMAALRPIIDHNTYGVVSAKTSSELLFVDLFGKDKVYVATDDGTSGVKGTPVDILRKIDLDFDMIYVCGPEMMMKSVYDYLAGKVDKVEFTLERSMKCGIGVCDSCSVSGYQVCKDGPVFSLDQLTGMEEFGKWKLSYSGMRTRL